MEKKFDVIALGELLIDFTSWGTSEQGNSLFEACPGGAPCNVLALLNKMGKKTAFYGKVGDDQFGRLLKDTITEAGIDASHLLADKKIPTTLAFVHTFPDGDREFSFYRSPGADVMLTEQEIDEAFIKKARIFHFGSLSMTHEGVFGATQKAVKAAKEAGLLLSFDPNLRPPLWESMDLARERIRYGLSMCDVLKIADNEIQFLTGCEDYDEGVGALLREYPIPLVLLTMGKDGSRAYYKGRRVDAPGFRVRAVETTGAGDTFCGSSLLYILEHGIDELSDAQLRELLTFANAAAALVTTKKGAIKAMPTLQQVQELREKTNRGEG